MRIGLVITLIFIVVEQGWARCTDQQLSFVPNSSSYLPATAGSLTESKNPNGSKPPASIMQKLDLLTAEVLGKTTHYQTEARRDGHFAPMSSHKQTNQPISDEEGFCDQWSASSLDKLLQTKLKNIGQLQCGSVIFTPEEIRELVTGYYLFGQVKDRLHFGGSFPKFAKYTADWMDFLRSTTQDKLEAKTFDHVLNEALIADGGAIMSITADGVPWNQPIYRSLRCEEVVSAPNSSELSELPPRALHSANGAIDHFLNALAIADDTLLFALINDAANLSGASEYLLQNLHQLQLQLAKSKETEGQARDLQ